jgi:hypothetical protein
MPSYKLPIFNAQGQVVDEQHRPLATIEYVDDEIAGVDTSVDYSDLPAYMTLVVKKNGATWPGPPTLRSDIIIIWKGADPSPPIVSVRTLGTPGMLDNVDLRMIT